MSFQALTSQDLLDRIGPKTVGVYNGLCTKDWAEFRDSVQEAKVHTIVSLTHDQRTFQRFECVRARTDDQMPIFINFAETI